MINWKDPLGFIHLLPDPHVTSTENPMLFTATYYILKKCLAENTDQDLLDIQMMDAFITKDGRYKTTADTKEWGVSHDNATAWISLLKAYGLKYRIEDFRFSWRSHWRPQDFAYFIAVKTGSKRVPWITRMAGIISCKQSHKVRNGNKIPKTDGKILALLRALAMDDVRHYLELTKLIKEERHKQPAPLFPTVWNTRDKWIWQSWRNVFLSYYQNHSHPNVEMASRLK